MTRQRPAKDPSETPPPEPSSESQVDIANRVQGDLRNANEERESRETSVQRKATEFDGNPNVEGDVEKGPFGPPDDTPAVIPGTKDK